MENNDTKSIKEYLKDKNSKIVDDVSNKIVDPIKSISGNVINFLNPKEFSKNFSVITKSPMLKNIGTNLSLMVNSLQNQLLEIKAEKKNNFLLEGQKNKEIALNEKTVDLLEKIEGKEFGVTEKEKKKTLFDTIFGSAFAKIFGALGIAGLGKKVFGKFKNMKGLVGGIFKKIFGKLGLKGLGKGILAKMGGKGLGKSVGKLFKFVVKGFFGKILMPLFAAFDFMKGFKNVEEITGKTDIWSKVKAGISSIISGFLFGLISPKKIFEFGGAIKEKIAELLGFAWNEIKNLTSGINLEWISGLLNSLTFGLFPEDLLPKIVGVVKDKFVGIFINPFIKMKAWFDETKPFATIGNYISDKLNGIVTGMTDGINSIIQKFINFKDDIKNLFKSPLKTIKSLISGDKDIEQPQKTIVYKKIGVRPTTNKQKHEIANQIRQNVMDEKRMAQPIGGSDTNQTIMSTNTNNNIVMDDMSISSDDMDYRNLQLMSY